MASKCDVTDEEPLEPNVNVIDEAKLGSKAVKVADKPLEEIKVNEETSEEVKVAPVNLRKKSESLPIKNLESQADVSTEKPLGLDLDVFDDANKLKFTPKYLLPHFRRS